MLLLGYIHAPLGAIGGFNRSNVSGFHRVLAAPFVRIGLGEDAAQFD